MFWPIFGTLEIADSESSGILIPAGEFKESMKPPEQVAGKSIQPLITQVFEV